MPGPGGGHVWPPWSYNPTTGLVYIPSTHRRRLSISRRDPKFVPSPTDLGETGKGAIQHGACRSARPRTAPLPALMPKRAIKPTAGPFTPPPPDSALPTIGPEGHGNILVAWDPIARKRTLARISSAGQTQAERFPPAIWFSRASTTRLIAYRADNGDQLLDVADRPFAAGPSDDVYDRRQAVRRGGGQSSERANRIRFRARGDQGPFAAVAIAGVCAGRQGDVAEGSGDSRGFQNTSELASRPYGQTPWTRRSDQEASEGVGCRACTTWGNSPVRVRSASAR